MRAVDIAARLAAQVDGVVRLLLPKGRRMGQEWRVGGVEGDAGQSLGVHLTGDKAGVWSDFSTGQSGDLIGLWMATRNLDLRAACKEAMDYLGIREDRLDPPPKRYQRPDAKQGIVPVSPEHLAWLTQERRISPATVKAYRLRTRAGAVMFPALRDGQLIAAKYRALPKEFRQDKNCEPCLFGWQAQLPDARSVIITEGELDAMAWHTYGFPALSVPMGGGGGAKQSWITSEFDRLALYDVIYVNMDSDGPGQEAEREIVARLGRERCRVVRLPRKDANQCLMETISVEDMAHALREARTLDPAELHPVIEFIDGVIRESNRTDVGLELPWPKTHERLLLRAGETSIWAGINGHGKSAVINHVVAHAALSGARCCVASMEFRIPAWLLRLCKLIAATPHPTDTYIREVIISLNDLLWLFDVTGEAKAKRVLDIMLYARRRYGIDLFVIDNLTKCGFADDDYPGQKQFVEAVSDFARDEHTHVAIVAHMRKGESEDKPAGKMAVKGSGGITDMADTVIEVWRNKPKENWLRMHADDPSAIFPEHMSECDTRLAVLKQRANGNESAFALWFDKATTQFTEHSHAMPRPLLDTPTRLVPPES